MTIDAVVNSNLTCIEVDDSTWATINWTVGGVGTPFPYCIEPHMWFSENCNNSCSGASPVGIPALPTKDKELLYITDILGRTTYPIPNQILFYIYDDGSVEKRIQLEW